MVGKAIRLDGTERMVVGVLPSGFAFPDNNFRPDLLVPEMMADQDRDWNSWNSRGRLFRVIGRLKAGVKASALTSELAGILRSHSAEEPAQFVTMRKELEVRVTPLCDWLTGGVRRLVLVLQVSVAMLLFVAVRRLPEHRRVRSGARNIPRVRAIQGVESAAISAGLPLVGTHALSGVRFEGKPEPPLGGDRIRPWPV